MKNDDLLIEIEQDIFLIPGIKPSSHVYFIKGLYKKVLVDTGIKGNFPRIVEALTKVGVKVSEIDLVINTHEHYDHVGGNLFFFETALIAAHRFAATKIELQDEFVLHAAIHGEEILRTKVHLWLEDRALIDLGNFKFKFHHVPGHTSGCICIHEPYKQFMFTGDTVFAGGVISKISDSGSYGDYINSLERIDTLKLKRIFPGHGKLCEDPEHALKIAINSSKKKLNDYKDQLINKNKDPNEEIYEE